MFCFKIAKYEPPSIAAVRRAKISLWKMPATSPDLNPVEKFWGWLRRRLRQADLKGMRNKRPVLVRMAYVQRVRAICRSQRAQQAAVGYAKGLRNVRRKVVLRQGAASGS